MKTILIALNLFFTTALNIDSNFYDAANMNVPMDNIWFGSYAISTDLKLPTFEVQFMNEGLPSINNRDSFACFYENVLAGSPVKLSSGLSTLPVYCHITEPTGLNIKWWSVEKNKTITLRFLSERSEKVGDSLGLDSNTIYFKYGNYFYRPANFEPVGCYKCVGTSSSEECVVNDERDKCVKTVNVCKACPDCSPVSYFCSKFVDGVNTPCKAVGTDLLCTHEPEQQVCMEDNNSSNVCSFDSFYPHPPSSPPLPPVSPPPTQATFFPKNVEVSFGIQVGSNIQISSQQFPVNTIIKSTNLGTTTSSHAAVVITESNTYSCTTSTNEITEFEVGKGYIVKTSDDYYMSLFGSVLSHDQETLKLTRAKPVSYSTKLGKNVTLHANNFTEGTVIREANNIVQVSPSSTIVVLRGDTIKDFVPGKGYIITSSTTMDLTFN